MNDAQVISLMAATLMSNRRDNLLDETRSVQRASSLLRQAKDEARQLGLDERREEDPGDEYEPMGPEKNESLMQYSMKAPHWAVPIEKDTFLNTTHLIDLRKAYYGKKVTCKHKGNEWNVIKFDPRFSVAASPLGTDWPADATHVVVFK